MNVLPLTNVLSLGEALAEPRSLCDFSSRPMSAQVIEQWLEHKLLLVSGDKDKAVQADV